jgi:hypothetical protein
MIGTAAHSDRNNLSISLQVCNLGTICTQTIKDLSEAFDCLQAGKDTTLTFAQAQPNRCVYFERRISWMNQ